MSKSCGYVLRVCILILTAAALALAIVVCFVPLYGTGPSAGTTAQHSLADELGNSSAVARLRNLDANGHLTVFESQNLDLFNYKATVRAGSDPASGAAADSTTYNEKWELRTRYFSCANGRKLIQAAEGTAVVACVLCCANFILSIFLFCFQPVVRVPLVVYCFLAGAAEAVALGLMLHLFLNGWCPGMAVMKEDGLWSIKYGIIMMILSCAASVASCILALVLSCCH